MDQRTANPSGIPGEDDSGPASAPADEFLRALRELPVVLFRVDRHGRFLESTGAGLPRLGLGDGEAVGASAFEMYPHLEEQIRTALEGGRVHFEASGSDGDEPWCFDTILMSDGNGGATGLAFDITQRKRAEKQLALRSARMDGILRELPVVVFTGDERGRIVKVAGSGVERITDDGADELVGRPLDEIFPDATEHARDGTTSRYVAHGIGPSGPWWFDTFVSPVNGNADELTGFAIDVTERMRTRQALREQRDRMFQLADQAADAVYLHDLDGRIVDVNRTACVTLGHPRETLLGKSVFDIEQAVERERALEVWRSLKSGETRTVQGRHRRADGTEFPVEARIALARHSGRNRVLAFVSDVTERHRADEDRRRLEDKMRHSQKLESLGILAGGIAHDFNNLLTGVIGNVGLALEDVPDDSPLRGTLEQVERAASRAADLSRQMLAYSGRGRFVIHRVDLSRLVSEMAHLMTSAVTPHVELEFDLADDLPPVEADQAQLTQVVMNLITNAADAVRETDGMVMISTGIREVTRTYLADSYVDDGLPAGRYAYLEVHDEGCGMDAATCARLFDPFFTTKETGRGLGLAAALGIVRGHRGAIRVRSRPGHGTSIRVLLPCYEGGPISEPVEPAGLDHWQGAGTVLIVDDEETVRDLTRAVLVRRGLDVETAEDGRQAVEFVETVAAARDEGKQAPLDLVLLDLTMPHLNGDEALERIRAALPDLPVILMSGFHEQDVAHRFKDGSLAGFLHKPFRPEALVRLVRQVLSTS